MQGGHRVHPARIAVFVDGCFWHACPSTGTCPQANREWWRAKLELNVARDRRNEQALAGAGWHVIRVWEHEPINAAADRICAVVAGVPVSRISRM